jgi:hypothetical protein
MLLVATIALEIKNAHFGEAKPSVNLFFVKSKSHLQVVAVI